jgi:hypothetical protein
MTETEAKIINMQFRAAQAAKIKLPLEGSETITARQLEIYNEALLEQFQALLKEKEAL